jgi:preprotein translocase subunit SecG
MQSLALVIHVVLAIGVIGLVLIQHGKGADAGAAFGSGASATVFGARGSASFLTRATTLLAALFFVTSIFLFYLAANRDAAIRSVTDSPSVVIEAPTNTGDLPGGVGIDAASDAVAPPSGELDSNAAGSGSASDLPDPVPGTAK